jgi:L-methionine (R)-S-oxide reductase
LSEEIIIDKSLTKEEKYKQLLPQIKALVEGEKNLTTNLAQICAALMYGMDDFFWVGFYSIEGDELVLGPFQGPVACSRIKIPNGVCGACVERKESIIVPNVNEFPGHIVCSSLSKSEIVVPIFKNGKVTGVLDVDSDRYNMFDEIDRTNLEEIGRIVSSIS